MCYRKHLRQVRYPRRRAKAQQQALLTLERLPTVSGSAA
jgi:hypothetical protein